VTQKDRPKLPLLVLAAGGILLGAAALQSVLITVPGPGSSNPHAITVDTKPAALPSKPWDEPSKSPTVEVTPAEPADPSPTGAVPDAPQSADHAVDPAAPPSPAKAESTGGETATEPAKPVADEPKVETPPADLKPAPKPEPSQIAKGEPETVAAPATSDTIAAAPKPEPAPAGVAKAPEETLEAVAKAPAVPDTKPVEEAKVETLPDEPKPAAQPEPAQVAASPASEAQPEAEKAPEAPKTEVKQTAAAAEAASPKPEPAPVAKAIPRKEKPAPKLTPAEKPRETASAKPQGGLLGKPMALGFGRKPAPAAGKVSSGRYAANVRAAIGRHRPRVGGGGSATVAFSIGPGGGLQGVKIVRSSGKQAADQAAIATVRAAAPFPPPPAGTNNTFSIQIYFR
jgi:protein TonB